MQIWNNCIHSMRLPILIIWTRGLDWGGLAMYLETNLDHLKINRTAFRINHDPISMLIPVQVGGLLTWRTWETQIYGMLQHALSYNIPMGNPKLCSEVLMYVRTSS